MAVRKIIMLSLTKTSCCLWLSNSFLSATTYISAMLITCLVFRNQMGNVYILYLLVSCFVTCFCIYLLGLGNIYNAVQSRTMAFVSHMKLQCNQY